MTNSKKYTLVIVKKTKKNPKSNMSLVHWW